MNFKKGDVLRHIDTGNMALVVSVGDRGVEITSPGFNSLFLYNTKWIITSEVAPWEAMWLNDKFVDVEVHTSNKDVWVNKQGKDFYNDRRYRVKDLRGEQRRRIVKEVSKLDDLISGASTKKQKLLEKLNETYF